MLIVFVRALLLYLTIVVVLRIMGKREVGQIQPFELVIIILIAELAAIPMEDKEIPLVNGLIPIFALLLAHVSLTYLSLRSERARSLICGTPAVLVENGKLVESTLRRLRYNINDLLEQLRDKNIANIADVEFAILETNGKLSVIPKSQKRPVNPEDLQIPTKYEGLPVPLIIDGRVNHKNLSSVQLDLKWLKTELAKFGINDTRDVLFASLDTTGNLFYQAKNKAKS